MLKPKWPERRDLFPEFWVYVEQLRLLRSLGVTGAGSLLSRVVDHLFGCAPAKDKIDDPKACQDRVDKVKAMFKKMLSAENLFVLFYSLSGSLFIGGLNISVYTHNYIHML